MNSVCILLQEKYLARRFDSGSLNCANLLNCRSGSFTFCNQICRQQRAGPAKAGFAMNRNEPLFCTLLSNEVNEFVRLLKGRRTTVRDRQTKK